MLASSSSSSQDAEQGIDEADLEAASASLAMTVFAFLAPALGGLLFGLDIGATSGAIVSVKDATLSGTSWYGLSPVESGLVVSASLFGALVGSAGGLTFGDRLGRKRELLLSALFYLSGAALMSTAPAFAPLVLGRAVYGTGIGFAMHGAPMYISETAPSKYRGTLISLKEGFIVGGILLGYVLGFSFAEVEGGWRYMWGASAPIAVAFALGMYLLPESPRWIMLRGLSRRTAAEALGRLRGRSPSDPAVLAEVGRLDDKSNRGASSESDALGNIVAGATALARNGKALYIGLSLMLFQQITGQPSVLYYATEIFQKAGFGAGAESSGVAVILGVFKLLMTGVAVLTVDSLGRRPLLLGGVSGLTASLLVLASLQGALGFEPISSSFAAWSSVAALLLYVGCYQVSFGPIAWLIVGEVFPVEVRSAAVGCATIVNFGANFLVSLVLPTVQSSIGQGNTYLIFAVFGTISVVSIAATVPETKGKTLEQITALIRGSAETRK